MSKPLNPVKESWPAEDWRSEHVGSEGECRIGRRVSSRDAEISSSEARISKMSRVDGKIQPPIDEISKSWGRRGITATQSESQYPSELPSAVRSRHCLTSSPPVHSSPPLLLMRLTARLRTHSAMESPYGSARKLILIVLRLLSPTLLSHPPAGYPIPDLPSHAPYPPLPLSESLFYHNKLKPKVCSTAKYPSAEVCRGIVWAGGNS